MLKEMSSLKFSQTSPKKSNVGNLTLEKQKKKNKKKHFTIDQFPTFSKQQKGQLFKEC